MKSVLEPDGCISVIENKVYTKGKFLYSGTEKFFIKGVTYGTYRTQSNGIHYPEPAVVDGDFAMMAVQGINCVRTYTVPPKYVLDIAHQYNLKVMIGLPWEQHIAFLDNSKRKKDILRRIQEGVSSCGEHPAILCYTIGNEIPSTIVRWYGKSKIEAFIKQLYKGVKAIDPTSLVTYVNYPTTEYLDLNFLDFNCFNVYLETPEKLSAYISRLHNLSGERPLVLAEIGLDSLRKGKELQANTLAWQIKTVFAQGCAGMFVFAWTDEWWRGGYDIEDWDFGIVDRQRNPKPALYAVSETMRSIPFAGDEQLPFMSVIVCSYNGSATIEDCLQGLMELDYPAYEVIVVNDGSQDGTADIAKRFPVKLITTPNCGLSNARNTGLSHAKGEIVAYIDDDAYPDTHWLRYLAYAYLHSSHVGIGGPNLSPPNDGPIAKCVAHAPGGPVHVLVSDETAEHIPGCNMSFRKTALTAVGGFDPIYHAAGDDVDLCWRMQEAGETIGFHPSAVVWHHRRNSIKAYWNQQKGYGKAEALLEAKWPEKYNDFGHVAWSGRLYGNGFTLPITFKKNKVFYGTWGSALFQSVYQPTTGFLNSIPLMPEWYLFSGLLAILAALGSLWKPLLWVWPAFVISVIVVLIQAAHSASKQGSLSPAQRGNVKYNFLIIFLHLIQPVARLYGRFAHGLTPWRTRGTVPNLKYSFVLRPKIFTYWSEEWRAADDWLAAIEKNLMDLKTRIKRGGDFNAWDLQAGSDLFFTSRCLLAIEEHGGGKQFLRLRYWPKFSPRGLLLIGLLAVLSLLSAMDHQWIVSITVGTAMLSLALRSGLESARSMNSMRTAFERLAVANQTVVINQVIFNIHEEAIE